MPDVAIDGKWIAGGLLTILVVVSGWVFSTIILHYDRLAARVDVLQQDVASVVIFRDAAMGIDSKVERNAEAINWLRSNCVIINKSGRQ